MATNLVFSVQKAFIVLDLLIFEDRYKNGLRLSEISAKTGIKPNTLHNILRTMIEQNYVRKYENGNYGAGTKVDQIYLLGQLNSKDHEYGPLSVMESLRDDINENIIYAVLADGIWKLVREFTSNSAVQVNNDKFVRNDIYEMATGRIMTSFCTDRELKEILNKHGLPGDRWDGIKSLEVLDNARRFIRKKGWVDMYTQNDQLWAIGIPVVNDQGKLIGAIGCAAPAFRSDDKKKEYIRRRFLTAASEIREILNAGQ